VIKPRVAFFTDVELARHRNPEALVRVRLADRGFDLHKPIRIQRWHHAYVTAYFQDKRELFR